MSDSHLHPPVHPLATAAIGNHREALAPEIYEAFERFSRTVFKAGALPEKTK